MDNEIPFDLIYLIDCGLTQTLKKIIENLSTTDQICLAATCRNIKAYVQSSPALINIQRYKSFNLDTFPRHITSNEVDALFTVCPYLENLKLDLNFAKDHFLDSLHKFKNLRKLTFYLSEDDYNYNVNRLSIKKLTVRHTFDNTSFDPLYNLLEQFSHFEAVSIYNGIISPQTLRILENQKPKELKLQNLTINERKCWLVIKQILENENLSKLKLISHNYTSFPHPIIIMSDLIGHLDVCPLKLETLKFTLDQHTKILYKNLRYLKNLKQLTVHYNVQESTLNLNEIIYIAASLKKVEVKFVEYVCKFNTDYYTAEMITRSKVESCYFVDVIESMDKYMDVFPVNYAEYFVENIQQD